MAHSITNVEHLADALALMDADQVWTRLSYQEQAVRLLEHFNLTPADLEFEQVGRQAFADGDMAAPALNARVMEALNGRPVGDYRSTRIMQAFSRGYDAARDEVAVDHRRCIDNGSHLASSRHTRVECPAED
jgi:hypothetical protein